ncbi:hypothetical protein IAR55_001710 [Kwoniella newhampshirensis]|uniref:DNA excision repair protein ERCC-5 n=1 Tax=Kwoniella newhampshirensis TaxID=1651941 RepID=A0AAW0Z2Z8_9TREE
MGVKGLWSLLNPVARPVQLESMEGKRLAIDSSIWLYQFQATMRDKDGRVLVNAHVLGFLRRINKLLFHGIKPVFVFDGGAPALKRATIAERKKKKAGAAANHAKVAEKLFAAQMRREAVKAAQAAQEQREARSAAASASRFPDEAGEQIAEDAVYLEELEGRPGPSRPRPVERTSSSQASVATTTPAGEVPTDPEKRRKHFKKMDPYRLPETTMPTASTTEKPDARLATEEELKQFIDDVHPEDIDVESPEFRALPTEVQYEIIGDLRVRSRQQSHRRLADMLRAAPTALDFSMAQIKHLSQRNALTQQLLTVTDMVGKAHLTIPVRIAAERNREYVLVKRGEDEGGGWALGIREGTKEKPIVLDPEEPKEEEESDPGYSDSDVEEVPNPNQPAMDAELREHRRRGVLEAIAARYAPKRVSKRSLDVAIKPFGNTRQPGSKPLFDLHADEYDEDEPIVPTANDEALALALQQEELGSDEEEVDVDLARALALSRRETERKSRSVTAEEEAEELPKHEDGDEDDNLELEEVELVPSGRTTPVDLEGSATPMEEQDTDEEEGFEEVSTPSVSMTSIAGSIPELQAESSKASPVFEPDEGVIPLITARQTVGISKAATKIPPPTQLDLIIVDDEDDDDGPLFSKPASASEVKQTPRIPAWQVVASASGSASTAIPTSKNNGPLSDSDARPPSPIAPRTEGVPPQPPKLRPIQRMPSAIVKPSPLRMVIQPASSPMSVEMDDEVVAVAPYSPQSQQSLAPSVVQRPAQPQVTSISAAASAPPPRPLPPDPMRRTSSTVTTASLKAPNLDGDVVQSPTRYESDSSEDEEENQAEDADDSRSIEWSQSPPPIPRPALQTTKSTSTIPSEVEDEDGDMGPGDMAAEEDDYARFMAQIKNRDLNEVRTEIDDEIRVLNSANKVAMRDSDEITQTMIMQIQTLLRHFGIPYITAPMEAEAQCAKLAELGLVDGIITDDSDVFLFGGIQCFKNIFNDAKYAECFLSADIERELSLTRERLISLAYLLGSDYTIGLPGVGPVVALELLANFPGERGVEQFKEWWMKIQRGVDKEEESGTKWKKSFKKRYGGSIYLTADWPNPLVREAYKYPTTDESEEPFHWGFPKLAALRTFLHEELSWSISKVDDELTPIVQRIARRGKNGALNKQGTLDPFFDLSVGSGNYAPRRRTTANVSKRLMAVIKQYREAEARIKGQEVEGWDIMMQDLDEEDPKGRGTGKRRIKESTLEVEGDDADGAGGVGTKKRRRVSSVSSRGGGGRKRAGTASSVSVSEAGTESEVGIVRGRTASSRGRGAGRGIGRGRGRGRGKAEQAGEEQGQIDATDL